MCIASSSLYCSTLYIVAGSESIDTGRNLLKIWLVKQARKAHSSCHCNLPDLSTLDIESKADNITSCIYASPCLHRGTAMQFQVDCLLALAEL